MRKSNVFTAFKFSVDKKKFINPEDYLVVKFPNASQTVQKYLNY